MAQISFTARRGGMNGEMVEEGRENSANKKAIGIEEGEGEERISVLIIEDDAEMRETLSEILRSEGYEVHAVGTAEEGLSVATQYQICILDLKLPGMDGLSALRELKRINPRILVIIITAYATKETAIEALNSGAFMYLEKPFDVNELIIKVNKAADFVIIEEEKRKIEERYRSIVESINASIYLLDRDMRYLFANRKMLSILGVSLEELVGRKFGDFFGEHSAKEMEEKLRKVFETGEPLVYEAKSEHGRWFLRTLSPVKKNGEVVAVTVISRNITNLKRVEEELRRKNEELEWFAYIVSHDLRSPLVTVRGFVNLLRRDVQRGDKEKIETDLRMIEDAVNKMSEFMEDLLELSRIGRVANPPEDVPFGDIVREVLKVLDGKIKERGVEVKVAEDFPVVHVDKMRIAEMLQNIVENSIKYMGEQPQPKIEIGYYRKGSETVFFVKDNGIGIPKEEQEKVFQAFYKIDRAAAGTGMGLAIVKKIVEVHGGRIWVESEGEGKGCTFFFTLPSKLKSK